MGYFSSQTRIFGNARGSRVLSRGVTHYEMESLTMLLRLLMLCIHSSFAKRWKNLVLLPTPAIFHCITPLIIPKTFQRNTVKIHPKCWTMKNVHCWWPSGTRICHDGLRSTSGHRTRANSRRSGRSTGTHPSNRCQSAGSAPLGHHSKPHTAGRLHTMRTFTPKRTRSRG